MQIAKVLSEEDDVANASIINGSGFNGSSPDQGIFFFGLNPWRSAKEPATAPTRSSND